MGQSASGRGRRIFLARLAVLGLIVCSLSCDRQSPTSPPATRPAIRIASLVPAATDLLLAMHAKDRLVAVSNYDKRDDTQHLPRVGDYQNIDWEKLAELRPSAMVIQMQPDRMPPGLSSRAESMGIALVNVRIDRLEDVFTTADQLGQAMSDRPAAARLTAELRGQLAAIREKVKGKPRPRVVICVDSSGTFVAGHGTFLTDLLEIAGGENVVPKASGPYPSIDRELLLSLRPDVVLQLLPGATPQVLERATAVWPELSELPAVKKGRVHPITEWFVHQPGAKTGETAKLFAERIH